jgi:DNA phosphorothioation-associated putative methyltransferase
VIFIKEFKIEEYNPFEKTAIKRKSLSSPMRLLYDKGLLKRNSILDYATGHGIDVKYLKELGIHIEGYDKFNPEFNNEELLSNTYDTVICLYCFNVIADLHEHNFQLARLKELSNNIYIAVRSDSKAVNTQTWRFEKEYDGWITSNNSFQRFYTNHEMLVGYFGDITYIHNGKDFKLFRLNI